jgi:hypothetical protein
VVARVLLLCMFEHHRSFYFSFLIVCILDVSRYLVGVEGRYNRYFRDIKIFLLSKGILLGAEEY